MKNLNLKNKLLLLRAKLSIYMWIRGLNKLALLKKIEHFFRTKILWLVCHFTEHVWNIKVEWMGPKAGKHRTCSRCLRSEKFQSIFSTKIEK